MGRRPFRVRRFQGTRRRPISLIRNRFPRLRFAYPSDVRSLPHSPARRDRLVYQFISGRSRFRRYTFSPVRRDVVGGLASSNLFYQSIHCLSTDQGRVISYFIHINMGGTSPFLVRQGPGIISVARIYKSLFGDHSCTQRLGYSHPQCRRVIRRRPFKLRVRIR